MGFFRGDVRLLFEDVVELKPTIFLSVPRLYNKLFDKVMLGVNSSGILKKSLFRLAYSEKKALLKRGIFTHWLWDALVFSKVKKALGGRVKCLTTGSAPTSDEILQFLKICFSCDVIELYGQTEYGGATNGVLGDASVGHVGLPMLSAEIKLLDIPEMNYFTSDKPPKGEVMVRATSQFSEYFGVCDFSFF